jgi:hypothetical protein
LQEEAQKRDREFTALRTELARMNRDRQNLQDALSQATAELANRRERAGAQQPQVAGGPAKPAPSGGAPQEISTAASTMVDVPKPGSAPKPRATPAAAPITPFPRAVPPSSPPMAPAEPGLKTAARSPVHAGTTGATTPGPRSASQPRPAAGPSGTQPISVPSSAERNVTVKLQSLPKLSAAGMPKLSGVPQKPGTASEERPAQ